MMNKIFVFDFLYVCTKKVKTGGIACFNMGLARFNWFFENLNFDMRGDTCPIFENFRFSPSNSKNRVSTHFCTTSIFKIFLPLGTPILPLYPLWPPKTENFENFDIAQIMSETDSQRFSAISENFLKNFALSPKALFRDFCQFSSIFAKKGKNRKIFNLGPLHRLLSP